MYPAAPDASGMIASGAMLRTPSTHIAPTRKRITVSVKPSQGISAMLSAVKAMNSARCTSLLRGVVIPVARSVTSPRRSRNAVRRTRMATRIQIATAMKVPLTRASQG
jgi:hypothetical protein